jgi:23S rRNA (cytosine1962-C5)-methyltransferase
MAAIILKPGREKPVLNQHPWIFSGAIQRVEGQPEDIVDVLADDGTFLARGYWNGASKIRVRLLTWEDEPIDDNWWQRKLLRAIQARLQNGRISREIVTAYRVINAENDYLPGLVVDYYAGWLVLQAQTRGIERHKHEIARLLMDTFPQAIRGVYERSDIDARQYEGLAPSTGCLIGDEPPEQITIREDGRRYIVNIQTGHKTGFYLDQRENRSLLQSLFRADLRLQQSCTVLNLFSYTGGFGIAAAMSMGNTIPGEIINVDSSNDVLALAEQNFDLNHGDLSVAPRYEKAFIQADVFRYLRQIERESCDIIVLDPPKFAHNRSQVSRASRGYKDINLNAFRAVRPGGYLITFSCSGSISAELFQQIVFGALADSGRQAQILHHLGPGDDHPVAMTFPEGAYLKGLLLRVY